jgi:hypothetical protein|tara:strand:+ start:44071 stop:44388 length:318 start_codon:yes stop_codon:yes gene_type:complete
MSFEIILIGLCCLFLSLSIFLGWKLYQFSIIIINIEDSIEESLDILNKKYGKMNEILQRPIFFDSIEVRQVIADIRDCHNAILVVANKLTKNIGTKRDEAEEKDS